MPPTRVGISPRAAGQRDQRAELLPAHRMIDDNYKMQRITNAVNEVRKRREPR